MCSLLTPLLPYRFELQAGWMFRSLTTKALKPGGLDKAQSPTFTPFLRLGSPRSGQNHNETPLLNTLCQNVIGQSYSPPCSLLPYGLIF